MIDIKYEDHTETWFTVTEVAKLLNFIIRDNDKKRTKHHVGRNLMFKVLKYNKILSKKDNSPCQSFINMDLAKLYKTKSKRHTYTMPIFSENGLEFLRAQFKAGKYQLNYDKKIKINQYIKNPNDVF